MTLLTGGLNPSIAAVSFLAVVLSYVIIGASVNYRKLSHFNGPPVAGLSRLWLFWQSINANLNTAQFESIKEYGKG